MYKHYFNAQNSKLKSNPELKQNPIGTLLSNTTLIKFSTV